MFMENCGSLVFWSEKANIQTTSLSLFQFRMFHVADRLHAGHCTETFTPTVPFPETFFSPFSALCSTKVFAGMEAPKSSLPPPADARAMAAAAAAAPGEATTDSFSGAFSLET